MTKHDCHDVRDALSAGTPPQQAHLFTCPECRMRVRMGHAWRAVPRPQALEQSDPVEEDFVQRVVRAAREDRQSRVRQRVGLAAAAALIFFFFAGAGHRVATNLVAGAEDAYAQLVEPATLDSLLPE